MNINFWELVSNDYCLRGCESKPLVTGIFGSKFLIDKQNFSSSSVVLFSERNGAHVNPALLGISINIQL